MLTQENSQDFNIKNIHTFKWTFYDVSFIDHKIYGSKLQLFARMNSKIQCEENFILFLVKPNFIIILAPYLFLNI